MILNRTRATRSFDFEITRRISDLVNERFRETDGCRQSAVCHRNMNIWLFYLVGFSFKTVTYYP